MQTEKTSKVSPDRKPILVGLFASLALLSLYFAIVSLAQGPAHALDEFLTLAYLMIPLVAGFGIQVSLYSYSRRYLNALGQGSASVAGSGAMSTVSMIACCAHHVTDIIPLIGVTAATIFLTAYQTFFIILGLFSNLVGITIQLALIQRHHLYASTGGLARIMRRDFTKIRNLTVVLSLIALISLGLASATGILSPIATGSSNTIILPAKTNEANGLTIEVTPLPFSIGDQMRFQIKMDTHSGDLGFDLTKVAYMVDGNGTRYLPTRWSGSSPGGHHREGTLIFPSLSQGQTSIELVLGSLYGADRVFYWSLK